MRWLLAVATVSLAGCGSSDIRCAAGTVAIYGECQPANPAGACGPGTELVDGLCVPEADTAAPACVPACEDRACGDDSCGGSCGDCGPWRLCTESGTCVAVDCAPDCAGKACGDDGCGGSCGQCTEPAKGVCEEGACVGECVPACLGRDCGDDGCGGSCGACAGGSVCSPIGSCVPAGWICDPALHGAGDACDCGCGVPDVDCGDPFLATVGCEPHDVCAAGACTPTYPAAWTCLPAEYDDGGWCHCGCGAPDPDCVLPDAPVLGCGSGVCDPAGTCGPCTADCTGKGCGDDGCGGSCGSCPNLPDGSIQACLAGQCLDGCTPAPIQCETAQCGDDGCGGSCGTCGKGAECVAGQCEALPGSSCAALCGVTAPAGCSCTQDCVLSFDCCPDFLQTCFCQPSCEGKDCGDDGCGGSCGLCGAPTPYCSSPAGVCSAVCVPSCASNACGSDGCGGTCGTCAEGATCNGSGTCVGPEWICAAFQYGNGTCQCGCGLPDPDCATSGPAGTCPPGIACASNGYCDASFCAANDDCTLPKMCIGHFLAGLGTRRGLCGPAIPGAQPYGGQCSADGECAHGLCAAGLCRRHCEADADCPSGQGCLGIPLQNLLSGLPLGVVAVCDGGGAELDDACASQGACGVRTCLALVHPLTHDPLFRCGLVLGPKPGAECYSNEECGLGLVCTAEACRLPCPGGNGDCPSGQTCGVGTLHAGPTGLAGDDVPVATCVPEGGQP